MCFLPWWVGIVSGATGSCFSSLGLPSSEWQLQPDRWRVPLEPLALSSQLQPLCPLWLSKWQQFTSRTAHRQQVGAFPGRREESAVCRGALPIPAEQLWLWHVCYLYCRGLVREGPGGGLATPSCANDHPSLHHPEEGRVVQTDPELSSEWPLLLTVFPLARRLPRTVCRKAVTPHIYCWRIWMHSLNTVYNYIYEIYFYYSLRHTPLSKKS